MSKFDGDVMAKTKIPARAKDCVTTSDKIAFSLMVRSKWEELNDDPWSPPSAIHAIIDTYHDPNCPWSEPEWASRYTRAAEEKVRALRALERADKRKLNRELYGKSRRELNSEKDMNDLVDAVWDGISAGRRSVRVVHKRPEIEAGETYLVSFLLNLDKAAHDELVAEAARFGREAEMIIRDYVRFGFKVCFQDEGEEQQKAA